MKREANADGVTFSYGADLPKTQYRVERAVSLPRGMRTIYVQEWVENLAPFDRLINWMHHATFGPPFAEPGKTVLDSSGTAVAWESNDPGNTPPLSACFNLLHGPQGIMRCERIGRARNNSLRFTIPTSAS
jgi:hypothetical protein